ncbi:MAG: SagB/ThcOx family dehydrogenase [Actinomycetota bacterium]|nr:SagB/ThcOx family dehydrogenase [Actinomycetota bacterium]
MGSGAARPGSGSGLNRLPAGEYHRLTVHPAPADPRLVRGFVPMDWDRKPPQFKTYPGLEVVPLPRELDDGGLGRVLFLTAGVVRSLPMPGGPMWFRAAGSAGNLGPVEVYVVDAGGVYHYQPVEHGLVRLGDAPGATSPLLILTGVPWRTCWKYRERGFRHLWWDAGTMLANLLAVAPDARVELGFVDAEVAALVGAQGPSGPLSAGLSPHEVPLAVVALDGGPVRLPDPPPAGSVPAGHLADEPFEFPLVTAAFRAGELTTPAEVDAWRAAYRPASPVDVLPAADPIDDVIRRRGSCRQFAPEVAAPPELLDGGVRWAASAATLLEHFVTVFSVDGVGPGIYRLAGDGLERLVEGDVRAAARHLCLDQDLGGDGAFTVFSCADLDSVLGRLGNRGYRAAQLEAGVVEGRLHLLAYARGFGATGLTFYDDDVSRFFATRSAPMLVTAVGAPAYRSRPGGLPGHPVPMRVR